MQTVAESWCLYFVILNNIWGQFHFLFKKTFLTRQRQLLFPHLHAMESTFSPTTPEYHFPDGPWQAEDSLCCKEPSPSTLPCSKSSDTTEITWGGRGLPSLEPFRGEKRWVETADNVVQNESRGYSLQGTVHAFPHKCHRKMAVVPDLKFSLFCLAS